LEQQKREAEKAKHYNRFVANKLRRKIGALLENRSLEFKYNGRHGAAAATRRRNNAARREVAAGEQELQQQGRQQQRDDKEALEHVGLGSS